MSNLSVKIWPETIRSVAFGTIPNSYATAGSTLGTPLVYPSRMMILQNLTNANIDFSWDGVNTHLILPQNGFALLDVCANKSFDQETVFNSGTQLYVQYDAAAPTSGSVYLSTFYGLPTSF